MTIEDDGGNDEAELRRLIDERTRGIRAKDADATLARYVPEVRSFDLIDPLRYGGRDEVAERLRAWFSQFREGPIGFETRDLELVVGEGVAFAHGLNHVDAVTTDGWPIDMWWRVTTCFRKLDGRWMVVHEHSSVPFDMESGRASLGLKP
ncbi:MAG: YybH family protein [Longimicrobiaceae bacterium]